MRFGILSLAIFAIVSVTDAHADRRVALVIGNSAYQHVAKLPNPVNDARAVAALLRGAGFDVVESRFDLDAASLRRAMGDFTDIANDADVAVVYYAGHGIEVDGNNYLIPVDAVLARDVDVEDETVSVDRVMKASGSGEAASPRYSGRVPRQSVHAQHKAIDEQLERLAAAWPRSRS